MLSGNTRATKMKGPNQVLDRIKMGWIFSNQILAPKKQPPSSLFSKGKLSNADTSTFEHQIDEMGYELYGLTDDKIAIVDGKR